MTGKPFPTASEFDRDDVVFEVVMSTARFKIDIDADDFDAVNFPLHDGTRSRGQIKTKTDAITKHAIMKAKPPLNEPVF